MKEKNYIYNGLTEIIKIVKDKNRNMIFQEKQIIVNWENNIKVKKLK